MWNLPHDRLPNFVGRSDLLEALAAPDRARDRAQGAARARAITGPGGVGKTRLAVEYAYSRRDGLDVVWWVRAEEATTLQGDLAALGQALQLRAAARADLDTAVGEVRGWLEDHDRWMVVVDNATDAQAVGAVLPDGGGGQVLVTSRNRDWAGTAGVIDVDVLEEDEAAEYLLRCTGETDPAPALSLARALGCLPLALEKAGAYVAQNPGLGLSRYLQLFLARAAQLPARTTPMDIRGAYPTSVAVTCSLAVEAVEKVSPLGVTLLRACSFLAPEAIPLSLLSGDELPEPLATDPLAQRDALAALSGLGLVRSTWRGGIAVDRVVQAVVRDQLANVGRRTWAAGVLRLVDHAFPADSDDRASRARADRLLPHVLAVTAYDDAVDLEPQASSRLLARAGIHLQSRGQLSEARRLLERGLATTEIAYGPDCPEAAIHLGNLAMVHQDLGELADAQVCLERALAVAGAAYGPEDPSMGTFVANLGSVLAERGEPARARLCFEQALAIDELAHGPDHPAVASDLNNLALVLWSCGETVEAHQCFERALGIDEAVHGPNHPVVARDLANLALVLADLGELTEARRGLERSLAIVESAFGPAHPEVGTHLVNLALVLQDFAQLTEARACLERALVITEKSDGPAHPTVASVLSNLGTVLSQLGELAEAGQCFDRALVIGEAALGPAHPEVGVIRANRDRLLRERGRHSG